MCENRVPERDVPHDPNRQIRRRPAGKAKAHVAEGRLGVGPPCDGEDVVVYEKPEGENARQVHKVRREEQLPLRVDIKVDPGRDEDERDDVQHEHEAEAVQLHDGVHLGDAGEGQDDGRGNDAKEAVAQKPRRASLGGVACARNNSLNHRGQVRREQDGVDDRDTKKRHARSEDGEHLARAPHVFLAHVLKVVFAVLQHEVRRVPRNRRQHQHDGDAGGDAGVCEPPRQGEEPGAKHRVPNGENGDHGALVLLFAIS